MTSRERVEKAFQHIEPDRTPLFEYVLLPPVAEKILGRAFIEYMGSKELWLEFVKEIGLEKALERYVTDRIELAKILGHDMLYVCPNPLPGKAYYYDPLEEIGTHFELKVESDPIERLKERNKRTSELLDIGLPEESYVVYYFLKEEMRKRDIDLPVLAPAYFHGIWTDADLMQVMVLEPEVAKEHFNLATKKALKLIDDYIKIGIDQIGIGGDFAGKQLLISPDAYRQFIVVEVRKCARKIRESGHYSVNATDGNIWPVIGDFLIGCEVDAYLEIDMGAGMDLRKLKKMYGQKILFFGNMDCGNVLSFAQPEEIRRITFEILDAGWGNGGHVFSASNAITESVPVLNYLAMVNAYKEYFSLPLIKL